jgi:hypothetical protein
MRKAEMLTEREERGDGESERFDPKGRAEVGALWATEGTNFETRENWKTENG